MNDENIQRTIERLGWGARYKKIKNGLGREVIVILRSLSLSDKNWVNFIYEEALSESLSNGLMSKDDLAEHYEETGEWTGQHEKIMDGIRSDIKKMTDGLTESGKDLDRPNLKRLQRLIKSAEEKLSSMQDTKGQKFCISAENYADEKKINAIIYCSVHNMDGTKYWNTWSEFEEEVDQKLIRNLYDVYLTQKPVSQKEVRQIARSPIWRVKWNASKNCDDLFGKPILELDPEQEALLYWSQVYDNVFEAYERPSDEIINDDAKLDKWFEEQHKKKKTEAVTKGKDKNELGISRNVGRHGEVFVVANPNINTDAPDIQDIWNMNTEADIKFIRQQNEKMKKTGGLINEKDIRPDYGSRLVTGGKRAEFEISHGKKKVNRLYDY